MDDVRSLAHTKWNCKYHVVFAPKYLRNDCIDQYLHPRSIPIIKSRILLDPRYPFPVMAFFGRLVDTHPGLQSPEPFSRFLNTMPMTICSDLESFSYVFSFVVSFAIFQLYLHYFFGFFVGAFLLHVEILFRRIARRDHDFFSGRFVFFFLFHIGFFFIFFLFDLINVKQ